MSAWTKWRVNPSPQGWSRRAFLGGAAAAITLPWLPSLLPRAARADAAPPVRLAFWYCPNGMNMVDWTPAATGASWELTPILAPLGDLQPQVSVLSGLANHAAADFATGDHPRGTASFLSASRIAQWSVQAATTVDQVAAQLLGGATPFPSLQVKLDDGLGTCDPGYSCAYNENIAWANATTPLPALTSPVTLFDRLFSGFVPGLSEADRARRDAIHASVLDHAIADATALQPRLSTEDRAQLDAYLTSVRELELRITTPQNRVCASPTRPSTTTNIATNMDALTDLMVVAFSCDLTRFITFMQGNGGSGRDMGFLGIPAQHHWASHHMGEAEKLAYLTQINTWEITQFAMFLRKLRDVPEGAGTLLDSCLVTLGSEIADGNDHTHTDLPTLLAGGAGGQVVPGRHLAYNEASTADLHIAMLAAVGVDVATFGLDGTRPLPGLLS